MNNQQRKRTHAPVYKAKGISDGIWYVGHFLPNYWLEGVGNMEDVILEDTNYFRDAHYIDPDTLHISFNNHDWYRISEMSYIIQNSQRTC